MREYEIANYGIVQLEELEALDIIEGRPAFLVFKDRFSLVKYLTDRQKAQVLDFMYQYQIENNRELPEGLDAVTLAAIDQIRTGFEITEDNYIQSVLTKRANGLKGGRPKKPTETDRNR